MSLGTPFEGDSYTVSGFGLAPTLSDFDAVIVDMAHVGQFIRRLLDGEDLRDHSGNRIVITDGHYKAGEVSISELVSRRATEALQLLSRGGLLICILRPNVSYTIANK